MRKHGFCCRLVSICLSVTLVHCIHMAEDIIKLLYWSGSPIILVFWPQRRYRIPRGAPSAGAQNTKGEKGLKSPFISETVQDRPLVAMEFNRLSWPRHCICAVSNGDFFNDLTDPQLGFQGHSTVEVEYLIRDKVTIEH